MTRRSDSGAGRARRMRIALRASPVLLALLAAACGGAPEPMTGTFKQKVGRPYQINGVWYYPRVDESYDAVGIASWYGPGFHGRATANGETFNENALTAAHTTLPLPSYVEVTNLENGNRLVVRVNDRGPFADGRILDLSKAAARELGFLERGLARVRVRLVDPPEGVTLIAAQDRGAPAPRAAASAAAPPAALAASVPVVPVSASAVPAPGTPAREVAGLSGGGAAYRMRPVEDGPVAQAQAPVPTPAPRAATAVPRPAPERTEVASAASGLGAYHVQVGTFSVRDNADRLVAKLGDAWPGRVDPVRLDNGRTLYRVRLGPFRDADEAAMARAAAARHGLNDARIVTDPI